MATPAVWKQLAYADDVIDNSDFGAYSILAADTIATPQSLAIGTNEMVGRLAAGIVSLNAADILSIIGVTAGASAILKIVADAAALAALTPAEGWFAFNQDGDTLHFCTAAAIP